MKTCEMCGEPYNSGAAVCQSCKDKLEGSGSVVKRCDCGLLYKGATRSKRCPSCERKNRTQPCAVCGKPTFNDSRHFYDGGAIIICSDCLAAAPGTSKCVCKCDSCDSIVKASNPFNICPSCNKPLRNKHLDSLHKSMVSAGNCTVCGTYTEKKEMVLVVVILVLLASWQSKSVLLLVFVLVVVIILRFVLVPDYVCLVQAIFGNTTALRYYGRRKEELRLALILKR